MKTKLLIALVILFGLSVPGFSIDPKKEYAFHPKKWKLSYKEFKIKTPDDFDINMWIINPYGDKVKGKTVIIAGADAGNMGNVLAYATYLSKEGFRVVTFDYRGFGDSTEFEYNRDNLYHKEYVTDFVAVMNWCKKEYKTDKIGVLAYSMGTLISSIGFTLSPYDFYIGEGFYLSPQKVKSRILKHKNKEVHLPNSATIDASLAEQLNTPILIFTSEVDNITTQEDANQFCSSLDNAKIISYSGDHLRGASTMGMKEYINEITLFLDRN